MTVKRSSLSQDILLMLQKIEDGILIGLLLLMMSMAVLQIILRNCFDSGILWGDALIRLLVLWIGLIGAMVASRNNHHISIDVISRHLPVEIKNLTRVLVSVFTSLVCGVMAYFSLVFVNMERVDGLIAFAGVPVWICESIIPISFAIISLRYGVLSFILFAKLFWRIPK